MKKQIKLSIFAFLTLCAACAPAMGMEKLKDFYKNNRTVSNIMLLVGAGATGYGIYEIYQNNTINSKINKLATFPWHQLLDAPKLKLLCTKHNIEFEEKPTYDFLNINKLLSAIKTKKYGIFTAYNSELIADILNVFNEIETEETLKQKLALEKKQTEEKLEILKKQLFNAIEQDQGFQYYICGVGKVEKLCQQWKVAFTVNRYLRLTFEYNVKALAEKCSKNPQAHIELIDSLIELTKEAKTEN